MTSKLLLVVVLILSLSSATIVEKIYDLLEANEPDLTNIYGDFVVVSNGDKPETLSIGVTIDKQNFIINGCNKILGTFTYDSDTQEWKGDIQQIAQPWVCEDGDNDVKLSTALIFAHKLKIVRDRLVFTYKDDNGQDLKLVLKKGKWDQKSYTRQIWQPTEQDEYLKSERKEIIGQFKILKDGQSELPADNYIFVTIKAEYIYIFGCNEHRASYEYDSINKNWSVGNFRSRGLSQCVSTDNDSVVLKALRSAKSLFKEGNEYNFYSRNNQLVLSLTEDDDPLSQFQGLFDQNDPFLPDLQFKTDAETGSTKP